MIRRVQLPSTLSKYLGIIAREFLEICLFRKGPQDLPAARELFWLATGVYTLMSAVLSYPSQTLSIAMLSGIVETLILLCITFVFLYLRSVPRRWMQVATALAGTGVIFSLLVFPLYYLRVYSALGPGAQDLMMAMIIFLWFWNISVMSHILKNAFSSSYVLGALGALAYIAIIMLSLQQMFPVSQSS